MKFQVQKQCRKCGIIILNSSLKVKNRAFCKYCFKTVVSEIWQLKKDKANARRRPLRRLPQSQKNCLVCNKSFLTAKKEQYTCGDDFCQKKLKNARARIKAREERKFYTKNCLVCKSEFVTTQPRKLNCKDECIREYKNNKKEKLQNEK